jgi:diketogulonate reductase-like aldo/keto reductase
MREFRLQNGDRVPAIGFGTFGSDHYSPEQVSKAVAVALEAGYRMFDCAEVYGNEDLIGEVFDRAFQSGLVKRKDLFITGKVWNNHHAAGEPTKALRRSLSDLKLTYVDAYFVHWPFPNYHAPGCDGDSRNPDSKPFSQEEFLGVWRELEGLHDQGLMRHLGMSNMTISKLEAVLPGCRVKPSMIEMELHPSFQQQELFDYCVSKGIQVIGFCPLGSPNRPERDRTPEDVADTELHEVVGVSKAHGIHPALTCLKWAVQKGAIPIPFSGSEKNIRANLAAANGEPLTETEMELLKKAERGCRLVKGQVFLWPGAASWTQLWE